MSSRDSFRAKFRPNNFLIFLVVGINVQNFLLKIRVGLVYKRFTHTRTADVNYPDQKLIL